MGDVLVATVAESRITPRRVRFAAALVILNLADVVLTRLLLDRGAMEGNPLMKDLMAGFAAPLGVKFTVAALAGALLMCCPARSRIADPAAATVVGLYVAVVAWNASLLGWVLFAR